MLSGCRLNVPTYLLFYLYLVYIILLSIKAPLLTWRPIPCLILLPFSG